MKKLLFAFIASAMLMSCSDDDKSPDQPKILLFDQIQPTSEMAVYAEGGKKIVSSEVISKFLAHEYYTLSKEGLTIYFSAFSEPNAQDYQETLFSFFDNRVLYSTEIKDIFTEGDATIMRSVIDNNVKDNPYVKSGLLKYAPQVDEYGRYYYQYVTHGNLNESIDVSLLYYKLVRYNEKGERTDLLFGTVHNEFNSDFLTTLGARDTLAVKEYVLKYKR